MIQKVLPLLILFSGYVSYAQGKIFLDKNLVACDSLQATYYDLQVNDHETGLIKSTIYSLDDTIYLKGYYEQGNPIEKTGTWICYYPNGRMSSTTTYSSGRIAGERNIYHDNGQLAHRYKLSGKNNGAGQLPEITHLFTREGKHLIKNGNGIYKGSSLTDLGIDVDSLFGMYRNGKPFGIWRGYTNDQLVLEDEYDSKGLKKGYVVRDGKKVEYKKSARVLL